MRKSCEFCAYYYEPGAACSIRSVRPGGCSSFELSLEVLMGEVEESLYKARHKHPGFVEVLPESRDAEDYESVARQCKAEGALKRPDQLRAVILSEVNEFLAEVARGNLGDATLEAADIIAVLVRALNGEGGTGDSGDAGDSGSARKGDGEEARS